MAVTYVAFLRGINLGKRRVKNTELQRIFDGLGFSTARILIQSGNVVFDADETDEQHLTRTLEEGLAGALGYPVSVMLRTAAELRALIDRKPFDGIEVTKETRLYVTLLAKPTTSTLLLPYESPDGAFRILERTDREVFSVLSLARPGQTVDVMAVVEKEYGRAATTRSWNTLLKAAALAC